MPRAPCSVAWSWTPPPWTPTSSWLRSTWLRATLPCAPTPWSWVSATTSRWGSPMPCHCSAPHSPLASAPTRLGRVAPGAARIPQPLPLAQRQGPAPWGPGAFSPLGTGASHSADAPLGPRPPPLPLHQGQGPQQVWGLSRSHKGTEDDHKITNSEDGREQEVPWTLCAPQRASVHPTGTGRLPPDERGAGEECPALFCCWSMLGPG